MICSLDEKITKGKRHYTQNELFTPLECGQIIQICDTYKLEPIKNLVQECNANIVTLEAKTHWIYDRICNTILDANSKFYHYNLIGVEERLQMLSFKDTDIYKWHDDGYFLANNMRKLVAVIQLTDTITYKDGDLQIWDEGIVSLPKNIGSISIFPGYSLTRCMPVSSGFKFCLILYISGPKFR